MICSSPTPHASKLASTEKPDFVGLLLLLDVVAVRVSVLLLLLPSQLVLCCCRCLYCCCY
jgi:hypothetical protein